MAQQTTRFHERKNRDLAFCGQGSPETTLRRATAVFLDHFWEIREESEGDGRRVLRFAERQKTYNDFLR